MGEIKIETLEVAGFKSAIKGMRNPLDSWDKSDSGNCYERRDCGECILQKYGGTEYCDDIIDFSIGENDLKLAQSLIKAGTEHSKFLRMIQVWADLTLPRYIFQEFDTYKFVEKNSCSTMHTLGKREFSFDDFYSPHMCFDDKGGYSTFTAIESCIDELNYLREYYLKEKDYEYVRQMKRILPESFLQLRTVNTNYAELRNIYKQRKNHRLNEEWGEVIKWIESLPYSKELITFGIDK